ncbi:MAG: SURF1 family protein [Sphingomicrobium sp.]
MNRSTLAALCLFLAIAFAGLGVWQVERRSWKLDLIARVGARVHAPAQPLPARATWPRINDRDDSYRHLRLAGVLLNDRETLVQAVTEAGPGWWVITPLRTADGLVLVNRGFVPPERKDPATRRAGLSVGPVILTGLLRMTEPGGGFLRHNDPATNRWYSRDVGAIARARGLGEVAPLFIDADSTPNPGGYPLGGLTVIAFRNAHLVYALTWFGLALVSLFGLTLVVRAPERR